MTTTNDTLAIRYRPQTLDAFIGQEAALNVIKGMMKKGRVHQKTLLSGPTGLGKTSLARVLAMTYNCTSPVAIEDYVMGAPCGECKSCVAIRSSKSRDVHEINCATSRGIAEAKTLLENAQYMPQSAYRIFILDEAHQLTGDAFKALLKGLEEPAPNTVFIMCSSEESKIPHEIKGRFKHLKLTQLSPEDCTIMLRQIAKAEGIKLDKAIFMKIALAVRGHARDALNMLEAVDEAITGAGTVDDVDALIARVVEEVIGEPPEAIATKFLLAVYSRETSKALMMLRSVTNAPLFCDALNRLHMQTINWWVNDEKLRDKYYVGFYEKLAAVPTSNLLELTSDRMSKLTDLLVWTGAKVRQHYANDPFSILVDMTLKCVSV